MRPLILFGCILCFVLTAYGCDKQKPDLVITKNSKVVYIDEQGQYLTFDVSIKNKSITEAASFQVKINILDQAIASKLSMNELLIGEALTGKKGTGKIYKVSPDEETHVGGTIEVTEKIDKVRFRKAIEKNKAIEALILNDEEDRLASEYINVLKEE
ncbi:hypothetical protein WMZ97_19725 [Lentibacillus sp. N15]|uniref:hypothetical protein n=1 Tax=Lentibacillus songyuanensis TaxID=3136161 RepID=UPI0031BB596B